MEHIGSNIMMLIKSLTGENHFLSHNRPPLVAILRMLLAGASSNVASAISAILQSRIPSPGDVMLVCLDQGLYNLFML